METFSGIITTTKRCKQPKYLATDEQINKLWYIHTMEYYSALKDQHFSSSSFKKHSKISSFLKSVNWAKYVILCTLYFCNKFHWQWFSGKEYACQCRRHGLDPQVRKLPWRRKWQPTSVVLPGNSHEAWWAIVHGVSKESDTTE